MAETVTEKKVVGSRSSDKVLYYYKTSWEPQSNPCHVLGTQGASSGTNTRALGTTATKQFNIKDTGSMNQQRVVNVIMTTGDGFKTDVARDLYMTNQEGKYIFLWRVDWNTLRQNAEGNQVVNAEYSQCLISALPETEALNTSIAQNVTFEVQGMARRYDANGNPFTLSSEDFDDGMFNAVIKFYNFTKPGQVGLDKDGNMVTDADDDSNAGDANGTVPMNGAVTAGNTSGTNAQTNSVSANNGNTTGNTGK